MTIGLDFDNTIVSYENVFLSYSKERNWTLPNKFSSAKSFVKEKIQNSPGGNLEWSALQGEIYGNRIIDAKPTVDLINTMQKLSEMGYQFKVISHKSLFPIVGDIINLHEVALQFLQDMNILGNAKINLTSDDCFFELTEEDKLSRIHSENCNYFIDDLQSIIENPNFPSSCIGILYSNISPQIKKYLSINRWNDLLNIIKDNNDSYYKTSHVSSEERTASYFDQPINLDHFFNDLVFKFNGDSIKYLESLSGGANNNVYKITTTGGQIFCGKVYRRRKGDKRNRFRHEVDFLNLLSYLKFNSTPKLLATDENNGAILIEYIDGQLFKKSEQINKRDWSNLVNFIHSIQIGRDYFKSNEILPAAEAFFSFKSHLNHLHARRNQWLDYIESKPNGEITIFWKEIIEPEFKKIVESIINLKDFDRILPPEERILSPSDFGMHNTLITQNLKPPLKFLDFEYAGWDDPAKTLADFICQPRFPPPMIAIDLLVDRLLNTIPNKKHLSFIRRFNVLFPLFRLKWAIIILNPIIYYDCDNNASFESLQEIVENNLKRNFVLLNTNSELF